MLGHKFSARSRSNFRIDLPRAQDNDDGQEIRGAYVLRSVSYPRGNNDVVLRETTDNDSLPLRLSDS